MTYCYHHSDLHRKILWAIVLDTPLQHTDMNGWYRVMLGDVDITASVWWFMNAGYINRLSQTKYELTDKGKREL